MQTLEETLEIFRKDALASIYDSFLAFKTFVDNTSDRKKLLRSIESSKISVADDLIRVYYPLTSIGQSQELKDYIKTIDSVALFKEYLEYYELTCLGYLNSKFPAN